MDTCDLSKSCSIKEEDTMVKVIVVIGPGSIGLAIARRVSAGKHVVLADLKTEHAESAAKIDEQAYHY